MSMLRQFKKGDVLLRQGDASDHVLRVTFGELEVLREVGTSSFVLGRVQGGEWLGEMGVIENANRSATARATEDGEVEVLTAEEFFDRVSNDPAMARSLIRRLSIRLRQVEDKLAAALPPLAHELSTAVTPEAAFDPDNATISLAPVSDRLRSLMGTAEVQITKLPFLVGRAPAEGESEPSRRPDLLIEDEEPYRLSRQHFVIARSGDRLLVSDVGSKLGTIVNGQPIGHHFMNDAAPLRPGDNQIVAGGADSPFSLLIAVFPR